MKSSPNQLRAITEAQINVALINRSSEKSETVAKTLRQMRIKGEKSETVAKTLRQMRIKGDENRR